MSKTMQDHPTVRAYYEKKQTQQPSEPAKPLDAQWLRDLCLEAGADDVGFVAIDRAELGDQRADVLRTFPACKLLISYVCRMNREPLRSPNRNLANLEFIQGGDLANLIGRQIVKQLEARGIRAMNEPLAFPMEVTRDDNKPWVISHKPIAVAAGLGHIGFHRNLIHPRFGNFVLLGTVLVDATISEQAQVLDYNPCIDCKLCVAACPVGAIEPDGHFNFSSCYTHTYRDFIGGFTGWIEAIADSKSAKDYRSRVSDGETLSMWQSLSGGSSYKASYCIAVCPAGEEVIGGFLDDRKKFFQEVVKPLQDKQEILYVLPGSDAEDFAKRHFPNKETKYALGGLRSSTIAQFLTFLPHLFQRHQAQDLHAVYHFTFTGKESLCATVTIQNKTISVETERVGTPDFQLFADSETWLRFLAGDTGILTAFLTRKIRTKGPIKLLKAFSKCFPS